jgi:hypothetical protein
MVDPTSDVGEVDPDDAPACAVCGDPAVGPDHRVLTWVADGRVHHRHFCHPAHRDEWDDERP